MVSTSAWWLLEPASALASPATSELAALMVRLAAVASRTPVRSAWLPLELAWVVVPRTVEARSRLDDPETAVVTNEALSVLDDCRHPNVDHDDHRAGAAGPTDGAPNDLGVGAELLSLGLVMLHSGKYRMAVVQPLLVDAQQLPSSVVAHG